MRRRWNILSQTEAGEGMNGQDNLPEDGEVKQIQLPSRYRIRALAVWWRARYLSITRAPHNQSWGSIIFLIGGKETFCSFKTWMPNRGSTTSSGVTGVTTPPLFHPCLLVHQPNNQLPLPSIHKQFSHSPHHPVSMIYIDFLLWSIRLIIVYTIENS